MGLLNFWKKKEGLDQPTVPPLDAPALTTDLPSMDGSTIDSTNFDGSNVQKFDNLQQSPSLDSPVQDTGPKSISFKVPTLDFTLPPEDDAQNVALKETPKPVVNDVSVDEYEDVNKLFLTDETWKEPDWASFDPYHEDKIDKPTYADLKGEELPHFKDVNNKSNNNYADDTVAEPTEPAKKPGRGENNPLEIFVRGNAYGGVFTELEQMNISLTKVDNQMNTYEDMLKREEPLLAAAKDQMEYLYKKLNHIDKKVFVQ